MDTDRPGDIEGSDNVKDEDVRGGIDTATGRMDRPQRVHGPDMHLIPGQGHQSQVQWKEGTHDKEQAFQHQEEIAYHREQERMKNIADKAKKVFTTPRQS